ncbi:MAG TPA: endo alpha-1,4 polygalactosaminidase [Polyangiales bacterium]|nr:endo alpha-1,4 polygalactosaminidase [Polyangiales bacterium]
MRTRTFLFCSAAALLSVVADAGAALARGFPVSGPWAAWYGEASSRQISDAARSFRIFNIDADPYQENLSDADIRTLQAGGRNVVLSYLNLGSCEEGRDYFAECKATGALTTRYDDDKYSDEWWANLGNSRYRDLIVNEVAARIAARGVDGFYLDNLEVVEHGPNAKYGPCDEACSQGGLDLVWELRQRFPDKLIVMQNATSEVTRSGRTHGVAFPSLLDGVAHEEVYSNGGDDDARDEMLAWKELNLSVDGKPFWLAVEEYVGVCSSSGASEAAEIRADARRDGFSVYVTDASEEQEVPCTVFASDDEDGESDEDWNDED